MRVIAFLGHLFVGVVLAVVASAQANLGEVVVAPKWLAWERGEPVSVGDDKAPKCTLYAFFTTPAHMPAFAGDADYLGDLQKRFGDRGLVVVAVVPTANPTAIERWAGCRVVVDADLAVTTAWFADGEWPWYVTVLDAAGRMTFVGEPDAGLVDAVDATLAGRDGLVGERNCFALRHDLPETFDDAIGADVVRSLGDAVAHAPRDGLALGLLYLAHATKRNDAAAAAKVCEQAIGSLAADARPLARFVDLALRGDPRRAGLAAKLKPVMHAAAAAAPNDVAVQLAFLRTVVQAGDAREVGRQSMRLRKLVTATAENCLDYASILAQDENAPVHRDLATMALTKAAALGAVPRLLTAARYGVAVRCANDREEQKKLLDEYLKDNELRVSINNDCWYLMTELPTMGRYDAFAAGLAERMLEQRDAMDYFEFDTAALAMFLAGRFAEAVALQETALEKGGKENPEYVERLARYKAGQAPAPR